MTLKEKLNSKKAKLEKRSAEITAQLVSEADANVREGLGKTLQALKDDIVEVEGMLADVDAPAADPKPAEPAEGEKRSMNVAATMQTTKQSTPAEKAEARAKKFAETNKAVLESRSTLVSSGNLATPTQVGGINDAQNTVCSIVDMVKVTNCVGMGSYKVAYETAIGSAATQTEGSAATASDPTFAYVTMTPVTKSILSYISAQAKRQSPLQYEAKVNDSARKALRKAAAKVITDAIVASAINDTVSIATGFDEKTLRQIALNYGGSDNVEGNAVLFVNKTDLIKLGDVRGTSEKKAVYEITPDSSNPNTGMIVDGGLAVKYCINNDLSAGTVIYGNPMNCELALFSDYEIKVSEDYKFAENMDAIRGTVDLDADVVADGGFIKVTVTEPAEG